MFWSIESTVQVTMAALKSKVHSSFPVVASQLHFLHGDFLKDFLLSRQCYLTTPGKSTREISLVWEITLLLGRKGGITAGAPRQRQVRQTDTHRRLQSLFFSAFLILSSSPIHIPPSQGSSLTIQLRLPEFLQKTKIRKNALSLNVISMSINDPMIFRWK